MNVSPPSSPRGRLRLWPQWLVLLAAFVMIVQTWLADGLLVSCRVSGGSPGRRKVRHSQLICPLQSGPETMIVWTTKGTLNAEQEAQAGRDYRTADDAMHGD